MGGAGDLQGGSALGDVAHSIVFQPVRKEVVDYRIDLFGGNIFYGVDQEGVVGPAQSGPVPALAGLPE